MINFQPVSFAQRRNGLAQAPTTLPAGPASVATVPTTSDMSQIMTTLKWGTIGFGAGAATGYVLGKGAGSKGGGLMDSLIGGVGGLIASVLPRLLGISG